MESGHDIIITAVHNIQSYRWQLMNIKLVQDFIKMDENQISLSLYKRSSFDDQGGTGGLKMKSEELKEIRHRIISEEEQEFVKSLVAARIVEQEDEGTEILAVMLDEIEGYQTDALGEFFFMPSEEDAEVQFFVNLITISEDLSQETLGELCIAISMLNTYITTGAFAVDPTSGSLIYKNSVAIPINISYEQTKDYVNMAMGISIELVDGIAYMLEEVNEGKRDAKSVIDLFTLENEDDKFEW